MSRSEGEQTVVEFGVIRTDLGRLVHLREQDADGGGLLPCLVGFHFFLYLLLHAVERGGR